MKIRTGFVSNSSSSSFIIFSKEKPTKEHFKKIFKMDPKHVLSFLSNLMSYVFEDNTKKLIQERYYLSKDITNEINNMERLGYSTYMVDLCSEFGGLEATANDADMQIDYKDENFIMKNFI